MLKKLGKNLFNQLKKSKKKYDTKSIIKKNQIEIGNLKIDVEFKNIKNINLKVHSSSRKVSISAPKNADINYLKEFAISKLDWIERQQKKINVRSPKIHKEFVTGESHYFLGKAYILEVIGTELRPKIQLNSERIIMQVPFDSSKEQRESFLYEWYRYKLKLLLPEIIAKWEKIVNVKINDFGIKKMKTKWGTCNWTAKRIWLNLELAKKPIEVIEYIVVHELVHLLERYHNQRFYGFMSNFMPNWQLYKEEINKVEN